MNTPTNKPASHDQFCEDCGAVVNEGKVGCVRIFEEILAKEFSDYRYGRKHRLTVDAYSLQHPDEYMRSGKSFAAHLTGMCAEFDFKDAAEINGVLRRWLSKNPRIDKPLHLPEDRGPLTIAYIQSASDADEHVSRVREWAQGVWTAWAEHHDLARQLITRARSEH